MARWPASTRIVASVWSTLVLVATLTVATALPAFADDFTVTRTDDPPPNECEPDDCSLREAVIAANENPGPDTISLPPGTYTLTYAGDDMTAERGDLDIAGDTTIVGSGADDTVIDAGHDVQPPGPPPEQTSEFDDRVFDVVAPGASVAIQDLTIRGGDADADDCCNLATVGPNPGDGGGIRVDTDSVSLDLSNVNVRENEADDSGGGIALSGNDITFTMTGGMLHTNDGSDFGGGLSIDGDRNTATIQGTRIAGNVGGDGGAIGIDGVFTTLTIRDAFIGSETPADPPGDVELGEEEPSGLPDPDANRTDDGDGGAIAVFSSDVDITITGSRIDGNRASEDDGGAIYVGDGAGVNVTIRGSSLSENKADDSGGAIYFQSFETADSPSVLLFEDTDVDGNMADDNGGGIWFGGVGDLTVTSGSVDDNKSDDNAGGVYVTGDTSATFDGTQLNGNKTDDRGGAIWMGPDTDVTIEATQLSDNKADGRFVSAGTGPQRFQGGGAIFNQAGDLTITESELSFNKTDGSGGAIDNSAIFSAACCWTYTVQDTGTVTLVNTTLSSNTAGEDDGDPDGGSALYNELGDVSMEHVTVAMNISGFDGGNFDTAIFTATVNGDSGSVTLNSSIVADTLGDNCNAPLTSLGDNIDDDGTCVPENEPLNDQNVDPLLLQLRDNGGPTRTHALRPDSPAVDNEEGTLADCPPDPETDQRFVDRDDSCDTGAFELVPGTDVTVTKSDDPDPVVQGSTLTYTVDVANMGTETALGVELTDDLPDSVTFGSVSTTQGTCDQVDGTVECQFGDIAAGETVTVTIEVTPNETGTITNTATATTPFQSDTAETNNSVSEDTTVLAPDAGVARTLALSPPSDSNPVGTNHTVTAHVEDGQGDPLSGVTVQFRVTGDNGASGSAVTNSNGDASFTYTGNNAGDDTITAWADSNQDGQRQNDEPQDTASKTWTGEDPEEPEEPEGVFRLSGDDRFLTAIDISQDSFGAGEAGAVVLARADVFADALAGTPFAADVNAPLLLTTTQELRPEVRNELRRVLPRGSTVYLLGETAALSENVANQVRAEGYTVVRHGGIDRFATAVEIAQALGDPDTLMIATGFEFVDALAAGPAAIGADAAILLTHRDVQTPTTQDYLDDRSGEFVYAIGGPHVNAYAETPQSDESVFGDDRFATAAAVANEFFNDPTVAGLARSDLFPDSLTGGVHIGRLGGPMLVTPPTFLHDRIETYFCTNAESIETLYIYGGPVAISSSVANEAGDRIRGVGC